MTTVRARQHSGNHHRLDPHVVLTHTIGPESTAQDTLTLRTCYTHSDDTRGALGAQFNVMSVTKTLTLTLIGPESTAQDTLTLRTCYTHSDDTREALGAQFNVMSVTKTLILTLILTGSTATLCADTGTVSTCWSRFTRRPSSRGRSRRL